MDADAWDRIADTYFEQISTPFQAEVKNPLLDYLDALPGRQEMTVADLGCGIGNLLPFLADRFKKVVAVDFSPKMLQAAQINCSRQNVQFCRQSLTDLSVFANQIDVAVTVNSVLAPSLSAVDQIFCEIAGILKPGGRLAGIFPSMESVLYEGVLILDRERAQTGCEKKALRRAQRKMGRNRFDFVAGFYIDGDDRQKFYYSFELRRRLQKAGFRGLQFGKVLYPWYEENGDEVFAGEPRMWDWFVRAATPAPNSGIGDLDRAAAARRGDS
jgi:ubiquinone/menaquinone biosynthesis C-methylase UbiE